MGFPIFRKRLNDKHFYRIISPDAFEEIQLLGEKVFKFDFEAKIYPDKVMIQDMISFKDGGVVEISELDFVEIEKRLK